MTPAAATRRPKGGSAKDPIREIPPERLLGTVLDRYVVHGNTHATPRHVGRSALIGLVAVVIAVSTGLAVAGGSAVHSGTGEHARDAVVGGGVRLTDSLGLVSSKGPEQIDEGLAQVIAPPSWAVQAQLPCPMVGAKGSVLLVGVQPPESKGCSTLPKPLSARSIVWIFTSTGKGSGKPVRVVNGFDLYSAALGGAQGYLVPKLGIELVWRGAEPATLISTLGWSLLHDVLVGGVAKTPASWKRQYFDGVSIAAPRSWPVRRPLKLECSGPFDHGPVVALGVHVIPVPCAYFPPPTKPSNGIIVSLAAQLDACPIRDTLMVAGIKATACSDPSVEPSELQVKLVFGSGTTHAVVYVVVGMAGNGTVARALLGSAEGIVPVSSTGRSRGPGAE